MNTHKRPYRGLSFIPRIEVRGGRSVQRLEDVNMAAWRGCMSLVRQETEEYVKMIGFRALRHQNYCDYHIHQRSCCYVGYALEQGRKYARRLGNSGAGS